MGSATRKYKLKWPLSTTAAILPNAQRVLDEIPDPPNDVIASTNDYESFKKNGKLQVHFGPTRYHLRAACITAKKH